MKIINGGKSSEEGVEVVGRRAVFLQWNEADIVLGLARKFLLDSGAFYCAFSL